MERNSRYSKTIRECMEEYKEEMLAIWKEFTIEILTRFSLPNKIDLQLTAEHSIKQPIQEEDSIENKEDKEKWILLDKQFIYGVEEEDLFQDWGGWPFLSDEQQEEDLSEKKEKLIQFKKQPIYGVGDQEKQRQRCEMLLQRNFKVKRNRGLLQRLRWFIWTQMMLHVKRRDLLFGREASLWRFTWLKKKPRIRLKE